MSKTDKTRPFTVQAAESLVALHDHSDGKCNLPTVNEWLKQRLPRNRNFHDCTYQPRNWGTFKGFPRSKSEKEQVARKKTRKYASLKDSYDN